MELFAKMFKKIRQMTWSVLAEMEALTKAEIQMSIKTTWSLHKNRGKGFIVKHFMPAIKAKRISMSQSRDQLIHRIKKCIHEFDMDIIIRMFDSLKQKIHKANEEGLTSLN